MTTPQPHEIAAVLRKAADVLTDVGWCRHAFQNEQGRMCAVGAIHYVISGSIPVRWDDEQELLAAARKQLGNYVGYPVMHFNDIVAKDVTEVQDAMRRAAEEAERDG